MRNPLALVALHQNLSLAGRAKIEFWAYHIAHDFARETTRTAERLGFASLQVEVGDLSDFDRIFPERCDHLFLD
jgi:hypothetical protein